MATVYTDSLRIKNNFGSTIVGVWVKIKDGQKDPIYFDKTEIKINNGDEFELGTFQHKKDGKDYWTITFLTDGHRLWGTSQGEKFNLSNQDCSVLLEVTDAPDQVTITQECSESNKTFSLTRL